MPKQKHKALVTENEVSEVAKGALDFVSDFIEASSRTIKALNGADDALSGILGDEKEDKKEKEKDDDSYWPTDEWPF